MGIQIRIENPSRETRGTNHEVERLGNWGDVFVVLIYLGILFLIINGFYAAITGKCLI